MEIMWRGEPKFSDEPTQNIIEEHRVFKSTPNGVDPRIRSRDVRSIEVARSAEGRVTHARDIPEGTPISPRQLGDLLDTTVAIEQWHSPDNQSRKRR